MTALDSTHAGLLRAILDAPQDDAPRLIFADWLEEQGDAESVARADFIRVQCALSSVTASLPPEHHFINGEARLCRSPKCKPCRLRWREKKILRKWECQWAGHEFYGIMAEVEVREALATGGSLRRDPLSPARRCFFHRGFIDEVSLSLIDWRQHGPQLLRQTPLVTVRISDHEPFALYDATRGQESSWWSGVGFSPINSPDLPKDIFALLAAGEDCGVYRRYESADAAHADLSQAALQWAHQQERTTL